MIRTEKKTINGNVYSVTLLGAKQGRLVLFRLTKALGPVLAAMPGMLEGKDNGALATALQAATPDDFEALCDAFASSTKVSILSKAHGEKGYQSAEIDLPSVFDQHFAGRYLEMIQWLTFAVSVNFADFFDAMRGSLGLSRSRASTSEDGPNPSPRA